MHLHKDPSECQSSRQRMAYDMTEIVSISWFVTTPNMSRETIPFPMGFGISRHERKPNVEGNTGRARCAPSRELESNPDIPLHTSRSKETTRRRQTMSYDVCYEQNRAWKMTKAGAAV